MLIDGLAATSSSPNIVHPGLLWLQSFDPEPAVLASGRVTAAYDPLVDRSGGNRGKRSNRVKYRTGRSLAFVRPTNQLATGASFSFASIAASSKADIVKTATTLSDRPPLVEPKPAATAAQLEREDDPPSAYLTLAAGLLALALVGWRRSRVAISL
jgi:hypothetical protein